MRGAVEQLREQRDQEREQGEKERHDLKDKHERLREDARRELGIPEPKTPEREQPEATPTKDVEKSAPEPDIEPERDGDELGDTGGHVKPEPVRDDPPPLEPDSYIPADRKPPPPNMDFEMGD